MRLTSDSWLRGIVVLGALAVGGCVMSHEMQRAADLETVDAHARSDAHVTPDAHVGVDAFVSAACVPVGEHGCASTERACCPGSYCQHGVYVVEYDTCIALIEDGGACSDARDCASGRCAANLCRSAACLEEGGECFAASGCCAGFCPSEFTYGPAACAAPLAAGRHCYSNAWCASQVCSAGVCL